MKRGLRLFGHPLHAALIHAPLGLLLTAPVWDAIGLVRGEPTWWTVSFASLALGLVAAVPAAMAGFVDYAALEEGSPAEAVATRHMMLVFAALSAFVGAVVVRGGTAPPVGTQLLLALGLETAGVLLLALGGHAGGDLVYRHGVGRTPSDGEGAGPRADARGEPTCTGSSTRSSGSSPS